MKRNAVDIAVNRVERRNRRNRIDVRSDSWGNLEIVENQVYTSGGYGKRGSW